MEVLENQLDMFEESSRTKRKSVAPQPERKVITIRDMKADPHKVAPFTVVRMSPTKVIIWND